MVILLYYHIKNPSPKGQITGKKKKPTKAKIREKCLPHLKKYTLSQWFYLFDYKFICSKDFYRGKPTLFFISRKDTLNPFTPKSVKRNKYVPILHS